jgi:hypothetical protein
MAVTEEYCLLQCEEAQSDWYLPVYLITCCAAFNLPGKRAVTCSSETLANIYQTTWYRILEDIFFMSTKHYCPIQQR